MEKLILIKYGELTTKKDNRKLFINKLENNIKSLLKNYDIKIKKDRVRMYIVTSKVDEVSEKLQKIFGIHSVVICYKTTQDVEDIKAKVKEVLDKEKFSTFKVNTRRADKNFPIHSMDFNNLIGGFVLKNYPVKVDVHNPELLLNIEIRLEGVFIYTNELLGSGGYPVGVQGKGLLMLSGGIDSPVAGYMALKRGIDIECLYFESPPHTSMEAKNKVLKLANILNDYSGNIKVHVVPFTNIQETIYRFCPEDYMITIMRRMMYRIAHKFAKMHKIPIIVNGESVGQVASQTITSMSVINEVTNMPIIRPVACLDKLEIIEIAKKIGTYETSILPFEDCCTIFVPKHPVINPKLEKCVLAESKFNFDKMIDECIENIETITNLEPNNYDDLL
ncbi:MAG: tRNA 4-thiouridine(8) synthase ThiI [Bacillales bacterium]|nr:tRNA 4-thiouridine(8) synthase ThiI [Bacillales bacterium]